MTKKRGRPKKKKQKPAAEPTPAPPKVVPYPTAGQKVKSFEEKLEAQIKGKPQPKAAVPPAAEPEQAPEVPVELIADFIKLPFELWALSQNLTLLALTQDEAMRLAQPTKKLLDYYFPKIPPIAYAWFNLNVSAFWIMRPRLKAIAIAKKVKEKSGGKDAVGPNGAVVQPGTGQPAAPTIKPGQNFPQATEIKPEKL